VPRRVAGSWRPCLVLAALLVAVPAARSEVLRVGSKRFTESTILGEILTQVARRTTAAEHVPGMGNTAILVEALRSGQIDLYPEYLGTIQLEILHRDRADATLAQVDRELEPLGLGVGIPLGFQNSYAIGVRSDTAQALTWSRSAIWPVGRNCASACRTSSSGAPTAGRHWHGATG